MFSFKYPTLAVARYMRSLQHRARRIFAKSMEMVTRPSYMKMSDIKESLHVHSTQELNFISFPSNTINSFYLA